MNELDLRRAILDALEFEPGLDAAHFGVAVENGVVTLTGRVATYAEKLLAEETVRRVRGVRAIAQEISVRRPNDKKTADDEIAKRAVAILAWNAMVPDEALQVKVDNGWITLRGHVDWQYQKIAAETSVHRLSGVVGVSNLITLRPRADPNNVKARIEAALRRSAQLSAQGIRVEVSGSKVTLEGTVGAWSQRSAAEAAAWAMPGVSHVEDRLVLA